MQIRQINVPAGQPCSLDMLAPLVALEPHLVLVFAAPAQFSQGLPEQLSAAAWPAHTRIAGCSTAGEFSRTGVDADSSVITALRFDSTRMHIASATLADMASTYNAGQTLGRDLAQFAPQAILLLAPGLAINGSALIRGLDSTLPKQTLIFGGLAGDNADFAHTHVLLDDAAHSDLILAIGLAGERLVITSASGGGWQPFGPVRRVTAARENLLFTLDDRSALQMYQQYLGDYARDLPASALLFPLAILDEHGKPDIVRTILGINAEDESLILAGEVKEGSYLQMMHATTDALVSGAQGVAQQLGPAQNQDGDSLAVLVSCVGRRLVMGYQCEEEWEAVVNEIGTASCVAGFYSYGEIGPYSDGSPGSALHNQTMTITHISER